MFFFYALETAFELNHKTVALTNFVAIPTH